MNLRRGGGEGSLMMTTTENLFEDEQKDRYVQCRLLLYIQINLRIPCVLIHSSGTLWDLLQFFASRPERL